MRFVAAATAPIAEREYIPYYKEDKIMAKIPKEVQDFMQGKMGWVATASPEGVPNCTPKGSVRVIDDEHLVFADLFPGKPGKIF